MLSVRGIARDITEKYQLESKIDGLGNSLNPYDVASTALAVNFNTINVTVDQGGLVKSAELQTPLLPIMTRLGKSLPQGEHRINISAKPEDGLLLVGQLIRSFQRMSGFEGDGIAEDSEAEEEPAEKDQE